MVIINVEQKKKEIFLFMEKKRIYKKLRRRSEILLFSPIFVHKKSPWKINKFVSNVLFSKLLLKLIKTFL